MAVVDRHLALSRLEQYGPISAKVSAAGGIFTTQTINTTNATFAVGTQLDFPRFLRYQIIVSNTVTAAFSGGTFVIYGSDVRGAGLTETIAASSVCAQGTAGLRGSVAFATLKSDGISFSNFSLATAHSGSSNSVSVSVGHGNILGLPNAVKNASAVSNVFIGTTPQPGSFTVIPGAVPFAGLSLSNAIATNTPVLAQIFHSR